MEITTKSSQETRQLGEKIADSIKVKGKGQEVKNLGLEEIWTNPDNIVAIEWAERIKNLIPKNAIWIKFESLGEDKRKLLIDNLAETSSAYY